MQDKVQDVYGRCNICGEMLGTAYHTCSISTANAQTYYSQEEYDRLKAEIESLRKVKAVSDASWRELVEENERLRKQNADIVVLAGEGYEKLVDALQFYADERAYQSSWYGKAESYTQRARDTLKAIGIKE